MYTSITSIHGTWISLFIFKREFHTKTVNCSHGLVCVCVLSSLRIEKKCCLRVLSTKYIVCILYVQFASFCFFFSSLFWLHVHRTVQTIVHFGISACFIVTSCFGCFCKMVIIHFGQMQFFLFSFVIVLLLSVLVMVMVVNYGLCSVCSIDWVCERVWWVFDQP